MIDWPTTIEEARKRRYRVWAGNPNGNSYREGDCAFEVPDGGRSVLFHQCERKNGKGPDGLYCGIHAKKFSKANQNGGR